MWTLVFLTVCVCISLVMVLSLCLCWRKKSPKNDLLGLEGMVTQKNPDENVNHLLPPPLQSSHTTYPSTVPSYHNPGTTVVDGIPVKHLPPPNSAALSVVVSPSVGTSDDTNSSRIASTNPRRSLPDIPSSENGTAAVNWEPSGDNSSEHYATVGQYLVNAKRHTLPNGIDPPSRPSISQHSSISQADDSSPYEKVKYDKIKKLIREKEHPYAQLQPSTSRAKGVNEADVIVEERVNLLGAPTNGGGGEPAAPPRSRRSSVTTNGASLGADSIPAASAVAGGVAASPDLPYMTPPVSQQQGNFSGDSQDSSKGYTSISVREPLATIKAQTKQETSAAHKKKRDPDPHYSTVSDDSDDVYTTIPDPNQIYTSESETYARIPAHPITVEAEVNAPPPGNPGNEDEDDEELYEPPPQPHTVKQSSSGSQHSHSRQASSSSSIANVGSPKPEKRQANSPLPPPPPAGSPFDFAQAPKNLDDLYAKVQKPLKNKQSPEKSEGGDVVGESGTSRRREHNYETLRKINVTRNSSDPGYEQIRNDGTKTSDEPPGYASIVKSNEPESLTSDPGYEVLKNSATDPNYEELNSADETTKQNHRTMSNASSSTTSTGGYSRIKKTRDEFGYSVGDFMEPNYESMPNSEVDPYETVSNREETDNYESVSDLDPPYAKLNNDDVSGRVGGGDYEHVVTSGRGYENIDTSESSSSATNTNDSVVSSSDKNKYRHLNTDTSDSESPGYERIQSKGKSLPTNSSGSSSDEPNYSTVNKETKGDSKKVEESDRNHNLLEEDGIFQV